MSKILVQLNPDRTQGGMLSIYDSSGSQVGYSLSVLGKAAVDTATAHGNPLADPILQFGDTPAGDYDFIALTDYTPPYTDTRKYGPNGVIKLDPNGGQALIAKNNGRTGILIHGGDLNPGGSLRRTNGCLRLRNDEYNYLKTQAINLSLTDPLTVVQVYEVGSTSSSISCGTNASCDEADPPPGF